MVYCQFVLTNKVLNNFKQNRGFNLIHFSHAYQVSTYVVHPNSCQGVLQGLVVNLLNCLSHVFLCFFNELLHNESGDKMSEVLDKVFSPNVEVAPLLEKFLEANH